MLQVNHWLRFRNPHQSTKDSGISGKCPAFILQFHILHFQFTYLCFGFFIFEYSFNKLAYLLMINFIAVLFILLNSLKRKLSKLFFSL